MGAARQKNDQFMCECVARCRRRVFIRACAGGAWIECRFIGAYRPAPDQVGAMDALGILPGSTINVVVTSNPFYLSRVAAVAMMGWTPRGLVGWHGLAATASKGHL